MPYETADESGRFLCQSDGGMSRAYCGRMSTDHRKLEAFTLTDEFAIHAYTATRNFPTRKSVTEFGRRFAAQPLACPPTLSRVAHAIRIANTPGISK